MQNHNHYSESLLVHFKRQEELRALATNIPSMDLDSWQQCDLELLLNRAFYPLTGYLGKEDYHSVLKRMRLADGSLWPTPVCLDITEGLAAELAPGVDLALRDAEGFLLAVLKVDELWRPDLKKEARAVFGTDDPRAHPGVQKFFENKRPWYVSGQVEGLSLPLHHDFLELRLTPPEAHRRFLRSGWRKVIACHVDGPVYRAELEASLSAAKQAGAHLFFQPCPPPSDPGDLQHYTQVRSYILQHSQYPRNFAIMGLLALRPVQAGPREALLQALVRKNYGCSHFMVADDQADPFNLEKNGKHFYQPGAAYDLLKEHAEESGIEPVRLERFVYVEELAQHVPKSGLKGEETIREISPEELARRLEHDLPIPEWFCHPDMAEELRLIHPPRRRKGFTVFFTGLSGSGKSTMAKVLVSKFMELRTRPVTLLDGDIVRKNLSSELTFSDEHRNLNIVRIGFVASEITKNGGIAICAPIAPFEISRRQAREMISAVGGFVEVHVSTPLEICEERDRKGMYAKARAGLIKGYTGIDSPYEIPSDPELTIDTNELTPEEAAGEVLLYLSQKGYIE
jgi:sulfate adenylyltransferase